MVSSVMAIGIHRRLLQGSVVLTLALSFALDLTAQGTPGSGDATTTTQYFLTVWAGRASAGADDGPASAARFYRPSGLAVDDQGNLFIADTGNRTVRKITPAGTVSTVAGSATDVSAPPVNGSFAAARFAPFEAIAVDRLGVLYVGEPRGIRRLGLDGQVTTLAGYTGANPPASTLVDGVGSAARFGEVASLVVDAGGSLLASDRANHAIRRITATGEVTTLAGGVRGFADGTGPTAQFDLPSGLAVDAGGTIYVADFGNSVVRKITSAGTVGTLAGSPKVRGETDGVGAQAQFDSPLGLASDALGNLHVADVVRDSIRRVTPGGQVTTIVASTSPAILNAPHSLAIDGAGNLYVADTYNNAIRRVAPDGQVTAVAGFTPAQSAGGADGPRAESRFNGPRDVVIAADGTCYIADAGNHVIRRISPEGVVSTYAGTKGVAGHADGPADQATFNAPRALALDAAGNLYVGDQGNYLIRKITPGGTVTTLAGQAGVSGSEDGTGSEAKFSNLSGLAVDSTGLVYVAGGPRIRQVNPAGVVSTLNGITFAPADTWFSDVAVDAADVLYATIPEYSYLVKRLPGQPFGSFLRLRGEGAAQAGPAELYQLALDRSGNVFVGGNYSTGFVGRVDADGTVRMIVKIANYVPARQEGVGSELGVPGLTGLAVDGAGAIYFACGDNTIRKGVPATAPTILVQPQPQSAPQGGSATFQITAAGVPQPTFQWYRNGAVIPGATQATLALSGVTAQDAGDYTVTASNDLGSVTSVVARLTVSAGGSPGGGGGGGAPSIWFLGALAALGAGRVLTGRRRRAA